MVFEFDVDKRKREAEESEAGQGEKRKALAFPVMNEREKKGLPPTLNRAETLGIADFLKTGKKIDPRSMRTDGFDEGTINPQTSDEGILNFAFESDKSKAKFAKGGFRGIVNTKTLFTVGEGNKKEFVNVFNVSDKLSGFPSAVNTKEKFINKKKSKKKNNNIFDVGF